MIMNFIANVEVELNEMEMENAQISAAGGREADCGILSLSLS